MDPQTMLQTIGAMNMKELRKYIKDRGYNVKGRSKLEILNRLKMEMEFQKMARPVCEKPTCANQAEFHMAPATTVRSTMNNADLAHNEIRSALYANNLCMFGRYKYLTFEQVFEKHPEYVNSVYESKPFKVAPLMPEQVEKFQRYIQCRRATRGDVPSPQPPSPTHIKQEVRRP